MAYTHFHPLEALGNFFEGIFEFFKLVIILIIIIVIIIKYLKKKKNEGEIGVIPKFIKTKTFKVLAIVFLASLAVEYGFSIVKKTINNKSEYTTNSNDYIESDDQTPTILEEEPALKKQNVKESFYLGQDTLGGIVFFIQKDTDGKQHGLIVSKTETEGPWQSTPNETITNAKSTWDGDSNTDLMTNSPIKDYAISLGTDWYIPAIDELNTLYNARLIINKSLEKSNYTIIGLRSDYWASVELDQFKAYSLNCANGTIEYGWAKYQTISVRPIKAF